MVPYFGDFAEDATVRFVFNTFDSNDPSASVTITNLVDADLKVHKDGSTTQIVTDGASIAINFDGITGNHMVTIDTSVHADYTPGADYHVRMEGTTVDGATINAFIGHFSIENRFAGVDVVSINGDAPAAVRLALSAGQIIPGTVDDTAHTPTATEFEADDITEATASHYVGRNVLFTSGVLAGQMSDITAYTLTGGRGHFTVTALTEAPGNDDTFVII